MVVRLGGRLNPIRSLPGVALEWKSLVDEEEVAEETKEAEDVNKGAEDDDEVEV